MHPDTLEDQWDKSELDPQMHMLMESGTKCVKVTKDMCTLLNRNQMNLYLKILSVSAATNSINHPSVGLTKTYNRNQYVTIDRNPHDLLLDRPAPRGSGAGTGYKDNYLAGVLYPPVANYLAS